MLLVFVLTGLLMVSVQIETDRVLKVCEDCIVKLLAPQVTVEGRAEELSFITVTTKTWVEPLLALTV